jgi:hypothetical protein
MQNRPDKATLLEAVARFLATEVKPAIADPALAFRVLVAANLAAVVAAEVMTEEAQEQAELERLRGLLGAEGAPLPGSAAARKAEIRERNRALVALVGSAALGEADAQRIRDHVMLTLRGELLAQSPKFDTSLDIEGT